MKSARPTLTTLLIITLAGCFGGKFDDGKRLLEEGKSEEGIARLEEAVKENPKNPEYRATLVRQRELLLARHLAEADALRGQGNVAGAERAYQKALGSTPITHAPRPACSACTRTRGSSNCSRKPRSCWTRETAGAPKQNCVRCWPKTPICPKPVRLNAG